MPSTHGLPAPSLLDPPNGPEAVQDLADALDAQLLTTVTSLPGSPADGQRCLFLADATNGVVWDLRYRVASASAYKWEFVGGGSLSAEITTSQLTSSTSYTDLTTVGPQITVPLAGEFEIAFGARANFAGADQATIVPKIGSASENADDEARVTGGASGENYNIFRALPRREITPASTVVVVRYKVNTGSSSTGFSRRTLSIRPVRVG